MRRGIDATSLPCKARDTGFWFRLQKRIAVNIEGPRAAPDVVSVPETQLDSHGQGGRHWRAAVVVATVALVLISAYAIWPWHLWRGAVEPPRRIMLAVLPFDNFTGDAGQEYFSDGLTEEMISQLGDLDPGHLGVIARTSVMHYKHSPESIPQSERIWVCSM